MLDNNLYNKLLCIDDCEFKYYNFLSHTTDKKMLQEDYVEYVVQINGKKRAMIKTNKDISQEELISKIKNNEKIKNIFENKIIDKSFFVKNRLINILIK